MSNYMNGYGAPPLRRPHFTFAEAVKAFFKNYAKFDGRASRSEYWWVELASFILGVLFVIPMLTVGADTDSTVTDDSATYNFNFNGIGLTLLVIAMLIGLALIIPSISLTVRRLHDINKSGWWYLISFIPYIGSFVLFVFSLLYSRPEGARFDGPVQPWAPENKGLDNSDNNMNNYNGGLPPQQSNGGEMFGYGGAFNGGEQQQPYPQQYPYPPNGGVDLNK